MDNKITNVHKDLYDLLSDKTPPKTPTYDISIYDQQAFLIPPGVEMELVGISKQELAELRERLKKTQELELEVRRENAELREQLKECRDEFFKIKNNRKCIEDNTPHLESTVLFEDLKEEMWIPLSKLGRAGIDFDLIPSDEFLRCVKVQGFVDDDGDGYPVIKTDDGLFIYNKKKSVYPSEIQNKDKLDFDYIAWFNK